MISVLMYFYGLSMDEVLDMSFPRMQLLLAEMPQISKAFNGGSSSGGGQQKAPSNQQMLGAMRK